VEGTGFERVKLVFGPSSSSFVLFDFAEGAWQGLRISHSPLPEPIVETSWLVD